MAGVANPCSVVGKNEGYMTDASHMETQETCSENLHLTIKQYLACI